MLGVIYFLVGVVWILIYLLILSVIDVCFMYFRLSF